MFNNFNRRFVVIFIMFVLFFLIIIFRLASLMIAEGEGHREYAENRIVKSITISAPRGEIRDRYGRLLAGNRPSFAVEISKNELVDDQINEISAQLIRIFEKNGDSYLDEFPIKYNGHRFFYTFDQEIEKWKDDYDIPQWYQAKEAFDLLRIRYEIDETDPALIQQQLLAIPELTIPISIRTWKFTQEMQKDQWLQKFFIPDEHHRADEAFYWLRNERFRIPESLSDDDARKIMAMREQIDTQLPGFMQYQPVKIAQDISQQSVTMVEEMIFDLPGVSIVVEPVRTYPENESAAHILGNLGKISQQNEIEHYINEHGYLPSDIIGKTGIEHSFESSLKGTDGSQRVVVDSKGRLVRILEKEEPIPGETVFLTIDIEFQKKVEQILEDVLLTIQEGGSYDTQWGSNRLVGTQGPRRNANAGAVVVTDVKTGEVLAMASYPAYDPNLFVTGISSENWNSLMPDNPRDPLAPRPLMNIAMSTAVQPGSTYKMLVGLAGLEQGLSPDYRIQDRGYIQVGEHSFGNWLWNQSRQTMGNQNLYEAIAFSNNYYFYSVANAYDYSKNRALPFEMNIDTLVNYAHLFGLDDPTGIEIQIPRERFGGVPNPDTKARTVKAMLRNHLNRIMSLDDLDETKVELNDANLREVIEQLVAIADDNPPRYQVYRHILDAGIREERANAITDLVKYSYYNQTNWSLADTMNFAIGQGSHAYTPLQMANYMATLANGGIRHQVSIVKQVISQETGQKKVTERQLPEALKLNNPDNLVHIRRGMYDATITGGARNYFTQFPVKVAAKTGTAQREGKIPPADEVVYLKTHLSAFRVNELEVDELTQQLMSENRDNYLFQDEGYAMREAIKLLNPSIRNSDLDQFKDDYDNFSWFTGFAPYEDPQIAIAVLVFQGGSGGYGAPIFREIVAEYLGLNQETHNVSNAFNSFQTE
ncbi:penicillin-binding transpeptidase domain-containing protein [Anoxynatronum buryatiense]|uniref:Penicillin-binding protein 2 n=1 Tax=Anoxynatronum buryatiense TaxID=489973 RepID=A0AA46AIF0_9CLOT|nr:penicillin-binding transpeptidase domain-containing protein [Anoxynatronum buryatiense]SMP49683.1 penicillin-binding protein 2 [Anoxynatronum buryatiense]